MAVADLREELNCSVCLSIYRDPVMLSCGHNFCEDCIQDLLDTLEESGVYSCPECRAEFQERPALQRNLKLCNIVERFLCVHPEEEEVEVFCTYCVDAFVPAVKTCLQCEVSFCAIHLAAHNKSVEHILSEPTLSMSSRKCATHNRSLEYYCTDDQSCICVSCYAFGDHIGHHIEPFNEACRKRKEKLKYVLEKMISEKEHATERVRNLQGHRLEVTDVKERVSACFMDIREQLEALEKRILGDVTSQEEQVLAQVLDLIDQEKKKIKALSRNICQAEELCNITDPLTVLAGWRSSWDDFYDDAGGEENVKSDDEEFTPDTLDKILISVKLQCALADIVTGVKAKRGFCVQDTSDILLDASTAGDNVAVSGDLKTASWSKISQSEVKTQARFGYCQIFSSRSFCSGQHYWEVETSKSGIWRVGVAYPSIGKEGIESNIGNNKKSWCLRMAHKTYSLIHDTEKTQLPSEMSCENLGIFLDYEAGRLSFYQLCGPVKLLHTFSATFTEPLLAAFLLSKPCLKISTESSASDQ